MPLIIEGQFKSPTDFIWPVAGLIVVATLVLLAVVLIKSDRVLYLLLILGFSAPFLFVEPSGRVLAAVGLNIFLISFLIHRIRQEVRLSMGFSLSKFARAGLSLFFTVASLIVATFYLANINEEQAIAAIFPRATVDLILPILERQYGTEIPNKEETAELLYRATVEQIRQILGPYRDFLPLASAVIFFLAFKAFTVPLYYLTLVLAFFLIKVLIWSKIVVKEKAQIEVERLTL